MSVVRGVEQALYTGCFLYTEATLRYLGPSGGSQRAGGDGVTHHINGFSPMKTMAVSNPLNMMPRTPPVLFPEDELLRPAVIGIAGGRRSHPNNTTAIKEILSSVLNLPCSMKYKLSSHMDLQDSDIEGFDGSIDGDSDTDSDSSCIPVISSSSDDIRFNRHKACWDNSQTDSSPSSALDPLPLSPGVPVIKSPKEEAELPLLFSFPKCKDCTNSHPGGDDLPSQMNLPLQIRLERENRRFSSPNLSSHVFNVEQSKPNASVSAQTQTVPLNTNTEDAKQCSVEDKKLSHRRSRSYSSILRASDPGLELKTETLHHINENVFEPTVNLENENEHFLVADMFIAAFEKMKSNLAYEQWKEFGCRGMCWLTKQNKEACFARNKRHSESVTSVDSGYEGLAAAQQTSPTECVLEEKPRLLSNHDDKCEDYFDDEFVIIELEDYEKVCTPASEMINAASESVPPEPGSNSAQEIAKKLYRALRQQWQEADRNSTDVDSPRHCFNRQLLSKDTIPEEFESSVHLEEEIKKLKLRDESEWSPPRFQIVNLVHPSVKRNIVVASQNYLCAGCGTQVEPSYTNRLRYCEYLGKYFCDCCHCYAESSIPARIILKWNFSKYYVSNFSKNLLENIWESHTFDLQHENPDLYKKVRDLGRVKDLQEQLIQLKKLLHTCRFADRDGISKSFDEVPAHLTEELNHFTLSDLVKVKQGLLLPTLRQILTFGISHVDNCELCQAKGFICEFCQAEDVLFPFQTEKCARCEGCKACFHKKCFMTKNCPRCQRIEAREALLRCTSPDSENSEQDLSLLQ